MDDYWYNTGMDDNSGYKDQTSWNNDGDWSIGNEYDGYDPGMYDYSNLNTDYYDQGNLIDFWDSSTALNTGTGSNWNASGGNDGSITNTLSDIFQGGLNNPLVGKGLAALMEGYQNKQKQAAMKKIAAGADPWGSQRPFYQQQAKQAVTDPYSSPIVKAQIEQLQREQDIKDAAAGRRSNMLTSSPAVMAEMAQIALAYQLQMAQQGGYNIAPSAAGINAATSGVTSDTNGYISPLLTALGWNNQNNVNNSVLANLTKDQKTALAKQWATE